MSKINEVLQKLKDKLKDNHVITTVDAENLPFLNAIAPRSAPIFAEQYMYYNNAYHTVMQLIDTSETINEYVFQGLVQNNSVSISIDEEHVETNVIKKFLGKDIDDGCEDLSLLEKFNSITQKKDEVQKNANFLNYLKKSNDLTKIVTIRFFLKAPTLNKLESLISNVDSYLKDRDMQAYIQTNDLESDMKAILKFDNPVKTIMPSSAISAMLMHENVSIIEPQVSLLGYTRNGVYAPDYSSYRNGSFCGCLIGKQGSGKSSLLKRISEDDILNDEQVIILDMHANEYGGITDRYDIATVSFDSNKYINGYEIHTSESTDGIINETDITNVTSLMSEIFRLQSDVNDVTVVSLYGNHLNELYQKYLGRPVSDFNHKDWFISTDVLNYVLENERHDRYQEEAKPYIYKMKVGLEKMIKTYGYLFNHHTNIDIDLTRSLRFDLSFLENIKQENVQTAYLTLIMTYVRKACVLNEKYNIEHEEGKDKRKLVRPAKVLRVLFEEFGTSAKYKVFLNEVDTLMRLTRKCRVGFWFALHTIEDIDTDKEEELRLIKSIFALCATYIIGEIDEKTAKKLPAYIQGITLADTNVAKRFRKNEYNERQFIACNYRGQKVKFTSIVSPAQEKYFRGGV